MEYEYTVLTLGELEENCYIIDCSSGLAAVVDPGYEPNTVLSAVAERGLKVGAVLLTHGHFDHVGGAKEISKASGSCPVYLNDVDLELPSRLSCGIYRTAAYSEGDVITVGEAEFAVIQTPGHSMGSVCLLCGGLLFTGDTLFYRSCGRTDFPGGSPKLMRQSLARLAGMPGNPTVLPGHGPATTLGHERETNPYMTKAMRG